MYQKLWVYTRNPRRAERVEAPIIRRKKIRAFEICTHFYYAIIGVSYTQHPGYTLENPKRAERVVALASHSMQKQEGF